jgi:NAD(P)-dependent dehydrogenase (short-subunit alcohol dehydrogenase family)
MPNSLDISNRVAVVIGGTSGIGKALTIGLAEHGAIVIPAGRREDRHRCGWRVFSFRCECVR